MTTAMVTAAEARAIIRIDYTPGEPGSYRSVRVFTGRTEHRYASGNASDNFAQAAAFARAWEGGFGFDPSCNTFVSDSPGRYLGHFDEAGNLVALAEHVPDEQTRAQVRAYLASLPPLILDSMGLTAVLQHIGVARTGFNVTSMQAAHYMAHYAGMLHVFRFEQEVGVCATDCEFIANSIEWAAKIRPGANPALSLWLRNIVRSFPGAVEVAFRSQRRRKIRASEPIGTNGSDGQDAVPRRDYTYAYHYLVEETDIPALCAWIAARLSPANIIQDIAERSGPVRQRMDPDHPRWREFLHALAGPQGCNAHPGANGKPEVACGGDQQSAIRILEEMGFEEAEISVSCAHFDERGCPCDCNLLLLGSAAAPRQEDDR